MRRLFVLLIVLTISTVISAQLPRVTTTMKKATGDLANGVSNEGWFQPSPDALDCVFRNTAVGAKHAFDRYYEMRTLFAADDCTNKDLLSRAVTKENGDLDYEMLAMSVAQESSEIWRHCNSDDPKVRSVSIRSDSKGMFMVILVLRVNK